MYKQTILFIALIFCALCVRADDSIKVSAADLQSLIQRVERLEKQSVAQNTDTAKSQQMVTDEAEPQKKNYASPLHYRRIRRGDGEALFLFQ